MPDREIPHSVIDGKMQKLQAGAMEAEGRLGPAEEVAGVRA
jgi:hypothetical protein